MMLTHWYTFHCPEYWTGDKATPEPEMVSCPLCIRKLRAVELPDGDGLDIPKVCNWVHEAFASAPKYYDYCPMCGQRLSS